MYFNSIAFALTLMLSNIAANDQDNWIKQAEINAEKNLNKWPGAVDALIFGNNSKPVREEIVFLQTQVRDGVDNMKSFVPKLKSVVGYINSTVAASPNFFRRGILHSILWYIDGKRDNKSYYLFDGAVNWILKRLSALSSNGCHELETKLINAKDAIANLRDELDSNAQNYVKSIADIDELSGDICKNIEDIRIIANRLAAAFERSPLLLNADSVNGFVKSIIV